MRVSSQKFSAKLRKLSARYPENGLFYALGSCWLDFYNASPPVCESGISGDTCFRETLNRGRNLSFQQFLYLFFECGKVIDYNQPQYIFRYTVISVYDTVSRIHNFARCFDGKQRINFQNPAHCFAYDFNISLNCLTRFYVFLKFNKISLYGQEIKYLVVDLSMSAKKTFISLVCGINQLFGVVNFLT